MSKLHAWATESKERLRDGRLSRKEYERAVDLSMQLANELIVAYSMIEPGNAQMTELGLKRIAEAMRKVGLI